MSPKHRSSVLSHVGLFVCLILVIVISFDKTAIQGEVYETIEVFNAQDWGYSSLKALFGLKTLSQLGESPVSIGMGLLSKVPAKILPRLPIILWSSAQGFPGRPSLQRIDINIKFEDYSKILQDRSRAIESGILTNPTEVRAKIESKGELIKAKIRLKGDLFDHWRAKTRMSFRVSLKGDSTIEGFKRFSLHSPGSRQHPFDQIFQDMAQSVGVLSSRHKYVNLYVNGQDWGIMHMEEHMSKELLEKQSAKDTFIMKFGDEANWLYLKTANPYRPYLLSEPHIFSTVYQAKKVLTDRKKRVRYSYIANLFERHEYSTITDSDSFSKAAIHAAIWNNYHTLGTTNTRYYFNPYILKLEPITTDNGAFYPIEDVKKIFVGLDELFSSALLSDSGRKRYEKNVAEVMAAYQKIDTIIEYYDSLFPNDYPNDYSQIQKNMAIFKFSNAGGMPWEVLKKNESMSKEIAALNIPTLKQLQEMPTYVHLRHYEDGILRLYNLLPFPITLETLSHNGVELTFPQAIIPASISKINYLEIDSTIKGIQDGKFESTTSYNAIIKINRNEYTRTVNYFNPLLNTSDKQQLDFVKKNGSSFRIPQGEYIIRYPSKIDGNLEIEPGTTLRFSEDAYLIIHGQLLAEGQESKPIKFVPENDSWKGLYVFEADRVSRLDHVIIKSTQALISGILELTGGVTFYKAPVSISNTLFDGTVAEDALNLVKSEFTLDSIIINNTLSDGLDSDFSNGSILNSEFINIGGDAADFSGCVVSIERMFARHVKDKAVSGGEKSSLMIKDSKLRDIGVGIASKDGSVVVANNNEIINATLFKGMTYIKKPMFGLAKLEISNKNKLIPNHYLRQIGTELKLNSSLVAAQTVNVDKLYESEVMKK